MEFYSHPNMPLKDHLKYVGSKSKQIILSKKITGIDNKILSDVSYLIGICHDFGKYTTFFREHLKFGKEDPKSHHALISGLFTYEVVKKYILKKGLAEQEPYKYLPIIAYFVVKRHHLNLDSVENDVDSEKLFDSDFRYIPEQIENIETNLEDVERDYNELFEDIEVSFSDVFNNMRKYKKPIYHSDDIEYMTQHFKYDIANLLKSIKNNNEKIIYYLIILLLYSVLIDSDKKHAGKVKEIKRKNLPVNLIEKYISSNKFRNENRSNLNPIREKLRKSVSEKISNIDIKSNKIYTITAPTGTGKTLTVFNAALILRRRLKRELNLKFEPRIVYSLPFTSIIDQNFDVYRSVLKLIKDFEDLEGEYIIKHHYLVGMIYKTRREETEEKNADEIPIEESLALIESWESEIIVTTFIQLFYTIIGYKNRNLKKFHNIVNSIIILDEIQNIPIELWGTIRVILKSLVKYFNCKIILMTATKPLILEKEDYIELVGTHEKYFEEQSLNRVELHFDLNKNTINELYQSIKDWNKKTYLFVFNTINSSIKFYELIRKNLSKISGNKRIFDLFYLSANIIPKERRGRIEEIKKRMREGHNVIIVSTQIIEAGVDIDCEEVYRDIGPFDSIVQVCGRCNRNKKIEKGKAVVVNIQRDGKEDAYKIYDTTLIDITKEIIEKQIKIDEKDFLGLVNNYFEKARNQARVEEDIIDSIYNLCFDDGICKKPISSFKLIQEEPYKVDVFVEFDEEATKLKEKYEEIQNIKDSMERHKEWVKIKNKFYEYVISVDKKKIESLPTLREDEIWYIPYDLKSEWYDEEIGFNPKDDASFNSRCI